MIIAAFLLAALSVEAQVGGSVDVLTNSVFREPCTFISPERRSPWTRPSNLTS